MFDLDRWQEIWITISRNKMRSVLTAFGVFWGILMLVVMSGAGKGFQNKILAGSKNFAQNSAFIFANTTIEPYKGFKKGRDWNMRNGDIEMLKQHVPEIKNITGVLFGWKEDNNTLYGDKYGTYYVKGLHPSAIKIVPQELIYGRFINDIDIAEKRKVCIIGKRIYEELFTPGENPLGKLIRVNGFSYRIIGVSNPMTQMQIGGDDKESVILPFSTMQQSSHRGDNLDCIILSAYDNVKMSKIEAKITNLIKERNSISPNDPQALSVFNIEKQFTRFNYLFLGMTILIWVVGCGTLLAGIVGVSNIMLVTVRERTKEIGIRRALGASPRSILTQIMSESLLLTSIAGFLGLGAGVGLLQIADKFFSGENGYLKSPQIPFSIAIVASVVLLIFGVLAGLLPVWRALQIKPIDAIREE